MQRFTDSIFGWRVTPPERPVVAEPPPLVHPQARFLRLLNATSFESLEVIAEARALRGLPAGGVDEDYRVRRFSSMLEAGVALRFDTLDRSTAPEATRLMPLARRYVLRRDLRALDDLEPTESAPQREERTAFEPEPAVEAVASNLPGFDNNLRQLRERRLQIEQSARDFQRWKFDERQSALAGRAAPNPNDLLSSRVALIVKLAEWDDQNPELARELLMFERMSA